MNNRGVVLLEVLLVMWLAVMCCSEIYWFYRDFTRQKISAQQEYVGLFAAKSRLLLAYVQGGQVAGLEQITIDTKLVKYKDTDSGLWVYRYEQ